MNDINAQAYKYKMNSSRFDCFKHSNVISLVQ